MIFQWIETGQPNHFRMVFSIVKLKFALGGLGKLRQCIDIDVLGQHTLVPNCLDSCLSCDLAFQNE